jgi:catechol 2,3-dioxygenase-like lactoylglutathione lyase family enzyme
MVRGTHHVGFTVSSLERSLVFWRKFGFELESRFRFASDEDADGTGVAGADYELVMLTRPGEPFILELIEYRGVAPTAPPRNNEIGAAHLALQVDDVNALYEDMKGDVEFVSAPHRQEESGVVWVYAKDPDGITVELLQLLETAGGAGEAR